MLKMKFIRIATAAAIAATALLALTAVQASEQLADKHSCTACHMVDKKMVGPSFKDIAAKYKGDSEAAKNLAVKLEKGSSGVWGNVPMPGMPHISEQDRATLAAWVLKQ
jgi:cytochrome c